MKNHNLTYHEPELYDPEFAICGVDLSVGYMSVASDKNYPTDCKECLKMGRALNVQDKKNMSDLLEKKVSRAFEQIAQRIPRRLITRNGTKDVSKGGIDIDGLPYMYRSYLEGKEAPDDEAGMLLHKFVSSDQMGELHSHPWEWSLSFILTGAYRETRGEAKWLDVPKKSSDKFVVFTEEKKRVFHAGDTNFIGKNDFHRVELITPEVWTLFIHGPRVSTWGFTVESFQTPNKVSVVTARTFNARPQTAENQK